MATTYRVLGQLACAYDTEETVYTVPSSTQTIISSIMIANRSGANASFKVAVRPSADATTANKHYIFSDFEINAYSTFIGTLGITLSAGDKILIRTQCGAASISLFGSEVA